MSAPVATNVSAIRWTNQPNVNDCPLTPVWAQLDLDNGTFAGATGTGPGPWIINPFRGPCAVHGHMTQAGAGACNFTIEATGNPYNLTGGPVTLFASSSVLTASDGGDAGEMQTHLPYIRINRQSNTGTHLCTLTGKP